MNKGQENVLKPLCKKIFILMRFLLFFPVDAKDSHLRWRERAWRNSLLAQSSIADHGYSLARKDARVSPDHFGHHSTSPDDQDGWIPLEDLFGSGSQLRHHRQGRGGPQRLSRQRRNQHEPVFDQDSYRSAIDENIEVGSSVLTVWTVCL